MNDTEFDPVEPYYYAVVEVHNPADPHDRSMVGERSTEAETADWVLYTIGKYRETPGTVLSVRAFENDGEGHDDPVFRARGSFDQVQFSAEEWRTQFEIADDLGHADTRLASAFTLIAQNREQGMSR